MPPPAATTAAAAASPSFPRPFRWLPTLGFSRRRPHSTPRASPSRALLPSLADSGRGGCGDGSTRGFSEVFRRFDADGDGKISGAELLAFLTSAGEEVSLEDVETVVGDLDSDGDGLMDYGDFVRLMGRRGGGGSLGKEGKDEDLRAAFEMFVAEKGTAGCITPAGLRRALVRLGEERSHEECAAMIRAFDIDGNGVLDYEEFYRMMT